MKDFKELQKLIDDYYKCYDENGNETGNGDSDELSQEIETQLEYLLNWDSKLDEINGDINKLRKELKTHIHKGDMVYVKL